MDAPHLAAALPFADTAPAVFMPVHFDPGFG
jgi:hypothetical protein